MDPVSVEREKVPCKRAQQPWFVEQFVVCRFAVVSSIRETLIAVRGSLLRSSTAGKRLKAVLESKLKGNNSRKELSKQQSTHGTYTVDLGVACSELRLTITEV